MANHPNRSRGGGSRAANPSPAVIRAAREEAGLTQTQAAQLVHRTLGAWQKCEAGENRMDPAIYELFRIKTGLDPAPLPEPRGLRS